MQTDNPETKTIDIFVVIDTDLVASDSPETGTDTALVENADANTSTMSPIQGYMIVTGTSGEENQGSAHVRFDASPGDVVRLFAKSGSYNFEDCILIAKISHASADVVLEDFENVSEPGTTVIPSSTTTPLPAKTQKQTFGYWKCNVMDEGTESLSFVIALYTRSVKGKPTFAGFRRWAPQITVQLSPLSLETST